MIKAYIVEKANIVWSVVAILVAVLIGLVIWHNQIYSDPANVFNAMIENSLRTSSVTKQVIQEDDSQTLDQKIRFNSGQSHTVHGLTDLNQTSFGNTQIVTESIGTPTKDYVRYQSITTDQKSADGQDLDFSSVLGTWGLSEGTGETTGELYNEVVLAVVPVGNVPANERAKLLKLIRDEKVYNVDYSNVKRETKNGRKVYTYQVEVSPVAYVTLLKAYAESVGLTHLDSLDAETYQDADPILFELSVDVMSRRLNSVTYGSGRVEKYLGYGHKVETELPTESISVEELQALIQQVQ